MILGKWLNKQKMIWQKIIKQDSLIFFNFHLLKKFLKNIIDACPATVTSDTERHRNSILPVAIKLYNL